LAPAHPLGVLFLLQRSCLASALTRRPVTALWLWPFALRSSLGPGPPFPASSAFAAAAKPRTGVAAIPRGSAGGGRHPPDRADGHRRCGVKRTASIATEKPESETSRTSTAPGDDLDASGGRRAGRGYRRGAATWVCLGQALRSTAQRASPRRRSAGRAHRAATPRSSRWIVQLPDAVLC
jgi:hypothetical protein